MKNKKSRIVIFVLIAVFVLEIYALYYIGDSKGEMLSEPPSMRITQAKLLSAEEFPEEEFGALLVTVENYGATTRRLLPDIYLGNGQSMESCSIRVSPELYYDEINAAGAKSYEYYEFIPPGEVTEIVYPLDERNSMELDAFFLKGDDIYITLPEVWAKEQYYFKLNEREE